MRFFPSALYFLYYTFDLNPMMFNWNINMVVPQLSTFIIGTSKYWLVLAASTRRLNSTKIATQTPIITNTSTDLKKIISPITTLSKPAVSHYQSTREALAGSSAFIGHTYDKNIYIPTYNNNSWKPIHYFPWDDSLNYSAICSNVLKRITQNGTFYIISGSFNGGLGHKYISIFYSITYAILLGRRFLRLLLISFTTSPTAGQLLGRNKQLLSPIAVL